MLFVPRMICVVCVACVTCIARCSDESELSHVALRFPKADTKDALLTAAERGGSELAGANLAADECLAHPGNLCEFPRRQR